MKTATIPNAYAYAVRPTDTNDKDSLVLFCVKNVAPLSTRKSRNAPVNDADHGRTNDRRDDNDEDADDNPRNGVACLLLDLQHQVPPELVLLL